MVVFESSWEFANKIGGIYTCLKSKALEESKNENYYCVGPLNYKSSNEITEIEPENYMIHHTLENLRNKGINLKYGRWNVPGQPKIILLDVSSGKIYLDKWKKILWEKYGIDSLYSVDILDNSILFGGVVSILVSEYQKYFFDVTLHCHDWQASSAILLSERVKITTVLTLHSTVLGRYLCFNNPHFYEHLDFYDADKEAKGKGIISSHILEKASVKKADSCTVVGKILEKECRSFFGRTPDHITENGLARDYISYPEPENKIKLENFVKVYLDDDKINYEKIFYIFISGRNEHQNKGVDLYLRSLEKINEILKRNNEDFTFVCFLILSPTGGNRGSKYKKGSYQVKDKLESILQIQNLLREQGLDDIEKLIKQRLPHLYYNEDDSPFLHENYQDKDYNILKQEIYTKFNKKEDRVKIICHYDFIKDDNIFRLDYQSFVKACDMGIFPSFYESWGYTPHECLFSGISTVTTNLSGFGKYVEKNDITNNVHILDRMNKTPEECSTHLADILYRMIHNKEKEETRNLEKLTWEVLHEKYIRARKINKVNIISLWRNEDRRLHVKNTLKDLNYRIFDAVDGKNMMPNDYYYMDKYIQRIGEDPGRYGNSLSHIYILLNFLQSDRDYEIIFEDDVIYNPKFQEFVKTLNMDELDFDLITFGKFEDRTDGEYVGKHMGVEMFYTLYNFVTHGYLVTRKGAEKLLENFEKNKLDSFIDYRICNLIKNNQLKVITTKPTLVDQVWQEYNPRFNLPSTIWTNNGAKINNKKFLSEIQ